MFLSDSLLLSICLLLSSYLKTVIILTEIVASYLSPNHSFYHKLNKHFYSDIKSHNPRICEPESNSPLSWQWWYCRFRLAWMKATDGGWGFIWPGGWLVEGE